MNTNGESVRMLLDECYDQLSELLLSESCDVSDEEQERIQRLLESRGKGTNLLKVREFSKKIINPSDNNKSNNLIMKYLSNDVHVKLSRGVTYPSDIGVFAIHTIEAGVVVDRIPRLFLKQLGYTTDDSGTLPMSYISKEQLLCLPKTVSNYLSELQNLETLTDGSLKQTLVLPFLGPNAFIGFCQWVRPTRHGRVTAKLSNGDSEEIAYNLKIETTVPVAQGEELAVLYDNPEFWPQLLSNEAEVLPLMISDIPLPYINLNGMYYHCGNNTFGPFYRLSGESSNGFPQSVWLSRIHDGRWAFCLDNDFSTIALLQYQSECLPCVSDAKSWLLQSNSPTRRKRAKLDSGDVVLSFTTIPLEKQDLNDVHIS